MRQERHRVHQRRGIALAVAPASVTGMIRRLARQGLLDYERYRGVRLSDAGRAIALRTIRRHRVLETYLTEVLGYAWDRVHDEAERLEHAASDELVERLAQALGNPTSDPHGAPIPTVDGDVDERSHRTLADLDIGTRARMVRVSDRTLAAALSGRDRPHARCGGAGPGACAL